MLQWEHSAILLTFIKLPFVIKIFLLSIFEWPLKTGFTVVSHAQGFLKVEFIRSIMLDDLKVTKEQIDFKHIQNTCLLSKATIITKH